MSKICVSIKLNNSIKLVPSSSLPNCHLITERCIFKDSNASRSIMQIYIKINNKKYITSRECDNVLSSVCVDPAEIVPEPLPYENEVCGICIGELIDGAGGELGQPDGCAHLFCGACMRDYMKRRFTTCPICRADFKYLYKRSYDTLRPLVKEPNYYIKKQRQIDLTIFLLKHKIKLVN
ncbi:C3HC4 type Zn finger protein [Orgyia pseudotsugata single capsid nuclopolyhedrovirus]|nr:C3HC4 type Zn finger protein [Orgyia pseudotsugata single capsid nuclopolyhedrovirus]